MDTDSQLTSAFGLLGSPGLQESKLQAFLVRIKAQAIMRNGSKFITKIANLLRGDVSGGDNAGLHAEGSTFKAPTDMPCTCIYHT